MGWHTVSDQDLRKKILGRWADNPFVVLHERDGYEYDPEEKIGGTGPFFASASARPGSPRCGKYGTDAHNYRHHVVEQSERDGAIRTRSGGLICTADNGWSDRTEQQTAPEFGPMKCGRCEDTYEPEENPGRKAVRLHESVVKLEQRMRDEARAYDDVARHFGDAAAAADRLLRADKDNRLAIKAFNEARRLGALAGAAAKECPDRCYAEVDRLRREAGF